jgi:hypothetical protein
MILDQNEFEYLLSNNFKEVKHKIILDCLLIDRLFENITEKDLFGKGDDIKLCLDDLYVAGGYFFKYNENKIFAEQYKEDFKRFNENQAIDLFYAKPFRTSFDMDVDEFHQIKYTTSNGLDVYSRNIDKRIDGFIQKITIQYTLADDGRENIKIIDFFDAAAK